MARALDPMNPGARPAPGDVTEDYSGSGGPPDLGRQPSQRYALAATMRAPIPIVYGTARVPGRVIYSSAPGAAPAKIVIVEEGVVKTVDGVVAGATAVALCEAPIVSVEKVWRDSSKYVTTQARLVSAGPAGPGGFVGAGSITWELGGDAAAWSEIAGGASQGVGFKGVAHGRFKYLVCPDAKLPNLSAEVKGKCIRGGDTDAHPADVLVDLLCTARPGWTPLDPSQVVVSTGPDGTAASSFERYCDATGIRVARAITEPASVQRLVESLLDQCNAGIVWSGGKYMVVPFGDRAVGTYAPAATATVIDDDEILREGREDPVTVETVPESEVYNCFPVTINASASDYSSATYEWIHAADAARRAALYGGDGVRRAKAVTAEWLPTPAAAVRYSQLLALRSVHVRKRFRFRLGPRWGLLEPGDLISLSHARLGLVAVTCRITDVGMRDRGVRELVVSEWPLGTATPVDLTPQAHDGIVALEDRYQEAVQTDVDGKSSVWRQAAAPAGTDHRAGDVWISTDTSTNCPDSNCKGHTLSAAGAPQTGSYPHRTVNWSHAWSGSAWLDAQREGAVAIPELAAEVVRTSDYAETTGTVYPEGTSGTYATTGGMLRNNTSGGEAGRFSLAGLRVGRWRLDEAVIRAANALARPNSSSPLTIYRGSSTGAPFLMHPAWAGSTVYAVGDTRTNAGNVYVCDQAGTSAASPGPLGTGTNITDGTARWDYVSSVASQERLHVQSVDSPAVITGSWRTWSVKFLVGPVTDDDNLDALRSIEATFYSSSGTVLARRVVAAPDRRYLQPAMPSHADNRSKIEVTIITSASISTHASGKFNGYARITLRSALGEASRDFGQAPDAFDADWPGGATIPGAGSPPADGGMTGGACPSPETPILMANGSVKPAGQLTVDDEVWTLPEDGGAWGAYRVTAVSRHEGSRRVRTVIEDGRELVSSPMHRVAGEDGWRHAVDLRHRDRLWDGGVVERVEAVGAGPVIRITVDGARTYVAAGVLSHNLKPEQP